MASSKEFLDFVLWQLHDLPDITYRAMMGEFIIYYHGKIIGGIYDNRLMIKPTKSGQLVVPDANMEPPYPGAKPMIVIADVEDSKLLQDVFNATFAELA